jgi:hypothetical protein
MAKNVTEKRLADNQRLAITLTDITNQIFQYNTVKT